MTRKHRVYKYSSIWYAACGRCPEVVTAKQWLPVLWILEFHAREHRTGESLTGQGPVSHP